MIPNYPQPTLESVIQNLRNSEFKFYLTGSRFFNTAREDSDWDFFVEDDGIAIERSLRSFITEEGFLNETNIEYKDKETVAVWKHITEPIHIQIVKDARLKLDAQFLIQSMGLHWQIARDGKAYSKLMWNLAYKTVRGLQYGVKV